MIWGSLFRTTVILNSGASVPGAVHHAPCLGLAGSASSPAVPIFFILGIITVPYGIKNRYLRSRVIWKSQNILCFCLIIFGRLLHLSGKNRYLRVRRMRIDRKTLCFFAVVCEIDENRCTIVRNRPCRPPIRPPVRRALAGHPPSARPPVRPPGAGRTYNIHKLPINR